MEAVLEGLLRDGLELLARPRGKVDFLQELVSKQKMKLVMVEVDPQVLLHPVHRLVLI